MKYSYTCHRVKDNLIHCFKSNDEYDIGEVVRIDHEDYIITDID